jgi:hypothetical protein
MVHYFLAVVFFAAIDQRAPAMLEYHTTADACYHRASQLNAMEPQLNLPHMRALGAEAVCLKVDRAPL